MLLVYCNALYVRQQFASMLSRFELRNISNEERWDADRRNSTVVEVLDTSNTGTFGNLLLPLVVLTVSGQ